MKVDAVACVPSSCGVDRCLLEPSLLNDLCVLTDPSDPPFVDFFREIFPAVCVRTFSEKLRCMLLVLAGGALVTVVSSNCA